MILSFFIIFTLIGLLSYYIIFSRIKISSFDEKNCSFKEGVSVVICAKNELQNIKNFFPSWINQEYSNFELIIVNDQSTDGSKEYLIKLEKQYTNLTIIHVPQNEEKILKGKRNALFKGIQAAKNDFLLFTDADCRPISNEWIREMIKAFSNPKTEIILGYSPYKKEKSFLNQLIQFETLLTAFQYFGFAEAGMPYMSVGRNVAYKKSIFSEAIFRKSNKSLGGDDDLVFQQLTTKNNTAYQISKNSITESLTVLSFKDWFLQKKRHLGAGLHYALKFKILLGLFVLFNLSFYVLFFILLNYYLFYSLIILAFKSLVISFLIHRTPLFKVRKSLSIRHFLLIDIIYWFIYIIFALGLKF